MEPSMFKSVGTFRAMEYLDSLKTPDGRTPVILEWLAEDLRDHKDLLAKQLTKLKNFRRIVLSVLGLMIKGDKRYSHNATYIMAALSETDSVKEEIFTVQNDIVSFWDTSHPKNLLALINCVIHNGDDQCVLNVLALLGNLLKESDGITWLLSNSEMYLSDLLDDVISLVSMGSVSANSNAALIIARVCSVEKGRSLVCCHQFFDQLISHLIFSLESSNKEVVQNVAYALAQLCVSRLVCKVVTNTQWATNMVEILIKLLASHHDSIIINSCNALTSLASSEEGFNLLNNIQDIENMLSSIVQMLDSSADNKEIGSAAVRFLRSFVKHQSGRLRICQSKNLCLLLTHYESSFSNIPDAIKHEIVSLNQQLAFLSQPDPPTLVVQGARSILVKCMCQEDATYELWQGTTLLHNGQEDSHLVEGLQPFTEYSFRLRLLYDSDRSPFSAVVTARTFEEEPGECLLVSAKPISCHQIQISWDAPHCINGILKEYRVYRNDCMVTATAENSVIVSGLKPQRRYKLEVSCVNGCYEGPKVVVKSTTFSEVYNATSRPSVVVMSDQEAFVTWQKPLRLLGKLVRYELIVNSRVVYSGIDTKYTVKNLTAEETYEFMIAVVSTEITARSEIVLRKTLKQQTKPSKQNFQRRIKKNSLHSSLQDLHSTLHNSTNNLNGSTADLFSSDCNRQSPDHVSGHMMQSLLEQYSNDLSQSTPDISTPTSVRDQVRSPLLPKRTYDKKKMLVTQRLHQKSLHSSMSFSSSCQQREKRSSEFISYSLPVNSCKPISGHKK